jgi:hypothetical protein
MQKNILIFLFLLLSYQIFPKNINILFIPQGFKSDIQAMDSISVIEDELLDFYPLNNYLEYIKFEHTFSQSLSDICEIKNNTFDLNTKKLLPFIKIIDNDVAVIIFVIKSDICKAQGGTIGRKNQPIILITTSAKKYSINHEFAHSFFDLGDEYSGDLNFPPSEKEINNYKNLSLTKDKKEWLYIKEITGNSKIGFYEGGLGRKKNVYHPYPECLMQSLNSELCPVCVYYAIEKLDMYISLTEENTFNFFIENNF